jgi:hypothetical protein
MQHPGWTLVVVGVLIAVIGFVWMLAPSIPWLGRLPKSDLVAFFDKEADVKGLVPWDRVVAEMGDSMEPLDYYPPRWSVEQFPTKEQLQKMATERQ